MLCIDASSSASSHVAHTNSEVTASGNQVPTSDGHIIRDSRSTISANSSNRHSIRTKAAALLEEVVRLSLQATLPGASTIRTNLKVGDSLDEHALLASDCFEP